MRRPRPGIGTELLPVALVLLGLAGTLCLVILTYHRSLALQRLAMTDKPLAPALIVAQVPDPEPEPEPPPVVVMPTARPKPVEDPTKPILARLSDEDSTQRAAAAEADRQAEALEAARKVAIAESRRWRRREALVRAQVDGLAETAIKIEDEANAIALERDVLARERDNHRADLAKSRAIAGGYAVLPHKGVHGTWQRPVMIECKDGQAILQPKNLAFDMMEMSEMGMLRGSPFLGAIARELMKVQQATSPDGEPVVPYIYFIVRPDGVRPYYEARTRLEPLGIAFGYELVEQDWQIEFPDFDELATWDGFTPLRAKESLSTPPTSTASHSKPSARAGGEFVWPVDRAGTLEAAAGSGIGKPGSSRSGSGTGDGKKEFMWPTRPPGNVAEGDELGVSDLQGGQGRTLNGPVASGRGTSRIAQGAGPGGGAGIDLGSLQPPTPGREIGRRQPGRGGLGSPNGFDRTSTGVPRSSGSGLVVLDSDQMPGLDPANAISARGDLKNDGRGQGQRGSGTGSSGSTGSDSGKPIELEFPAPGDGPGEASGNGLAAKPVGPSRPPSGRVRIDPALLAYVDEAQEVLDRMNGRGRNSGGSGESGDDGTSSEAKNSEGSGTSRTGKSGVTGASGGSPPSGMGTPSSNGGSSGMLGVGTPSFGGPQGGAGTSGGSPSSAGTAPADSRPSSTTEVRPRPDFPPMRSKTIEVPLPLVVACARDGVTIHPGGYRLSPNALKKQGALSRDLEAIVRNHAIIDPSIRPKPRIEFLIEPGGTETYAEARKQTVLSGYSWPVSVQVSETSAPRVFSKERF